MSAGALPASVPMAAWACLLALALAACTRESVHRQEAYVFGTRVEVSVWSADAGAARRAAAEVLREFDRLHRLLHAWEDSELTRLNQAIARGETAAVPAEVASILADAARIAAMSDDLFNPAIGRLVRLWGFHSDSFQARLPPAEEIGKLAAARPRMADLAIEGDRVSSRNPDVAIDLGGYAKGYALDRAAYLLHAGGVRDALVNIGGNVMALGAKGRQPWRVGVQHPRAAHPIATLELRDGEAIGTSGDYQRYFEVDGRRYCHLIDPRTGSPGRNAQSVTVLITPRPAAGILSDAGSKPLFIADRGEWRQLARRLSIDHVLRVDASGKIVLTRAMSERIAWTAPDTVAEVIE